MACDATVTVLYESHCPDSRNFIHNDLVPHFHKLEPHVELKLIPFGKARSLKGGGFSCQHGPKECRGNMIMSCALNRLSPGRAQLNMVSCFMADPDTSGPRCCRESGVAWEEVETCMMSGEGTRLQREAEDRSGAIRDHSNYVPTVLLNEIFEQNYHNDAVNGRFKETTCTRLGITNC